MVWEVSDDSRGNLFLRQYDRSSDFRRTIFIYSGILMQGYQIPIFVTVSSPS